MKKEQWKDDKRSKWNRHWDGRHSKSCQIYSLAELGMICQYTREPNKAQTDLIRYNAIRN